MDKDFQRMSRFPPERCGGIVVVKIYRRNVAETTRVFRERFERIEEGTIPGNLVLVTPRATRVRRPRR